jgi:hypothetical protein
MKPFLMSTPSFSRPLGSLNVSPVMSLEPVLVSVIATVRVLGDEPLAAASVTPRPSGLLRTPV